MGRAVPGRRPEGNGHKADARSPLRCCPSLLRFLPRRSKENWIAERGPVTVEVVAGESRARSGPSIGRPLLPNGAESTVLHSLSDLPLMTAGRCSFTPPVTLVLVRGMGHQIARPRRPCAASINAQRARCRGVGAYFFRRQFKALATSVKREPFLMSRSPELPQRRHKDSKPKRPLTVRTADVRTRSGHRCR
jgi:hypothetical protein